MNEKETLIRKRHEGLPEITSFPKIEKVIFRLPERPTERYDTKDKIPSNLRFINEMQKDGVDKLTTKVSCFDTDYLNEVNTKRLDDLKQLDRH